MSSHNETYDTDTSNAHRAPCPICGPTMVEPSESEPTLDNLDNQTVSRGASLTLGVSFHATSPVTITWRVDQTVVSTQHGCIPHGQTQLTIRRFGRLHNKKRFSVEIVDRRGRRQSTGCILTMRHC